MRKAKGSGKRQWRYWFGFCRVFHPFLPESFSKSLHFTLSDLLLLLSDRIERTIERKTVLTVPFFDNELNLKLCFPRLDVLRQMLNAHHDRICKLEDQKYDLELFVKRKDYEVQTLPIIITTLQYLSSPPRCNATISLSRNVLFLYSSVSIILLLLNFSTFKPLADPFENQKK